MELIQSLKMIFNIFRRRSPRWTNYSPKICKTIGLSFKGVAKIDFDTLTPSKPSF